MFWLVREDHFVAQNLDVLVAMLSARRGLMQDLLFVARHECYVYIGQPTSELLPPS